MNQLAVEGKARIARSVIALSIAVILLLVAWQAVSRSPTLSSKELSASFDVTVSELSVAVMAFLLLLLIVNAAYHLQAGLYMLRPSQPAAARLVRNLAVLVGLGVGYAGMRALAMEFMYGFPEVYNYGFMALIGLGILLTLLDLVIHGGEVADAIISGRANRVQPKLVPDGRLVLPTAGATVFCTTCGSPLVVGAAFCGACGAPVLEESPAQETILLRCPQCGQEVEQDADFCTSCGQKLR